MNLWHTISRIWTCIKSEFRLFWNNLCSSDKHYTTASQEPSLIASNQQIDDVYKLIIFEGKRHCGRQNFNFIELFFQYNDSCCKYITGSVNIYSYACVSPTVPECFVSFCLSVCVCVFVCVWYQIRVPIKNRIKCQTTVNLMLSCIKHTSRS